MQPADMIVPTFEPDPRAHTQKRDPQDPPPQGGYLRAARGLQHLAHSVPAPSRSCHSKAGRPLQRAFTLIEMVGVLAIIAILAAAMVPSVVKQMDQAALTKETSDLSIIAAALQSHILVSKNIPSYANWVAAISDDAALPPSSLTNNLRSHPRAFLVDTDGWLGTLTLPYTFTTNGTTAPTNARILIVSSLGCALPVSNGAPSTAAFNDIWNTPSGAKPSTWTSWTGEGRDLVIQRINLQPLLHRLILINGLVGGTGQFSSDNSAPLGVPTAPSSWSAYYLDGTVIGLHDTNGTVVVRELLKTDMSRVFEYGVWRDGTQMGLRTNALGTDWATIAGQFLAAPAPPGLKWGGTPRGVASLINAYMYGYASWATESPCFSYNGNGNMNKCAEYILIQDVLSTFSKNGSLIP